MPRDGNGVYDLPPGTEGTPNTTILSAAYNAFLADIVADLNAARPITAGGTGLNTLGAKETVLRVNSAGSALEFSPYAPYPSGHLYGLTLSNNGSDATNDIDIAVGTARSSDDSANIDLTSALTKQLDAAWAVGTNAGMLATGVAVTNTTYHIFLIKRPDTGVVDIAADTSASGANIAANTNAAYTLKRRIGSILRVSNAIVAFIQIGDTFWRSVPVNDVTATNPGTSAVTRTLSVPTGIVVTALLQSFIFNGATATARSMLLTSLAQADTAPGGAVFTYRSNAIAGDGAGGPAEIPTNTSAQIRSRVEASDGNTILVINVEGWIDLRDKQN